MNYEERLVQDARLIMLRALAAQTDGRLNEVLLANELDRFGHRRSREWVRTQIECLRELGAVTVTAPVETVKVATLTQLGLDHVERRRTIDGIGRPSLEA